VKRGLEVSLPMGFDRQCAAEVFGSFCRDGGRLDDEESREELGSSPTYSVFGRSGLSPVILADAIDI